jgi:predicted nucleic acid-binding protein
MNFTNVEFIDTNILVYAFDLKAGVKHERAEKLIARLWDEETGGLSIQVLQETYVILTGKIKQPALTEQAREIVEEFSHWRVYTPVGKDILEGIDLSNRYKISFWDAMIIVAAKQLGAKIIWTEDLASGRVYEGIKVQNPFA